jgi:hypothetical protein
LQQEPHSDEADVDRPQEVQHGPEEGDRVPGGARAAGGDVRGRGGVPLQGGGPQQDGHRRLPGRAQRLQREGAQGVRRPPRLHRPHTGAGAQVRRDVPKKQTQLVLVCYTDPTCFFNVSVWLCQN